LAPQVSPKHVSQLRAVFKEKEIRARSAPEVSSSEAIRVGLIAGADATFHSYFNNTSTPTGRSQIFTRASNLIV
jgi:hypothetical protein